MGDDWRILDTSLHDFLKNKNIARMSSTNMFFNLFLLKSCKAIKQ